MAFHYISTVKKENKNAFRTVANKKADYVTLVGTTSLSTSNEPFLRMHEASYYLNIIANNSYSEWSDVVDKLKAYAKELSPSMKHYEAYQRDHDKEFYELHKDHPQFEG